MIQRAYFQESAFFLLSDQVSELQDRGRVTSQGNQQQHGQYVVEWPAAMARPLCSRIQQYLGLVEAHYRQQTGRSNDSHSMSPLHSSSRCYLRNA